MKKEGSIINFNTILITIFLSLIGWFGNRTVDKLDTVSNAVIKHEVQIPVLSSRIDKVEKKADLSVTRSEFARLKQLIEPKIGLLNMNVTN